MAPTGLIMSWQILLEIRAASSRSVGWARSVIAWTSGRVGLPDAAGRSQRRRTPRWPTGALAHQCGLVTRFAAWLPRFWAARVWRRLKVLFFRHYLDSMGYRWRRLAAAGRESHRGARQGMQP